MKQSIKKYFQSAIILTMSSGALMAGGDVSPYVPEPTILKSHTPHDEWKFQFSPMFLWAMSIDGDSTVGPVDAPLVVDFGDAIDALDMTFTLHFEATKDDWTLFTEYQYVLLRPSQELSPVASMDIDFRNYMFELGGAYTLSRSESSTWEAIAGLRYTRQDLQTTLKPANVQLLDISENWTDGFVGVRNVFKISDNWLLLSRADIGAGGSDFVWNTSVMADYRFNEWGSAFVGYKAMGYDYHNGETGLNTYAYDAVQKGLLLGLNIHW